MILALQKKILIYILLASLVVAACVIVVALIQTKNMIVKRVMTENLPMEINELSLKVDIELQKSMIVTKTMQNAAVLEFAKSDESNEEFMISYLDNLKKQFDFSTTFYISTKTHKYYIFDKVLKVVDKSTPKDGWFFRLLAQKDKRYAYNLDVDENKHKLTVFTDYKILNEQKEVVAIAGVGQTLDNLSDTISKYNETKNSKIYLINYYGNVALGGRNKITDDDDLDNSDIGKPYLRDPEENANLVLSKKDIVQKINRNHVNYIVATKYLPHVDWTILLEVPEDYIVSEAYSLAHKQIGVVLVLLCVIAILAILILNRMLRPLKGLSGLLAKLSDKLKNRNELDDDGNGDVGLEIGDYIANIEQLLSGNKKIVDKLELVTLEPIEKRINTSEENIDNANSAVLENKAKIACFIETVDKLVQVAAVNAINVAKNATDVDDYDSANDLLAQSIVLDNSNVAQRIRSASEQITQLKQSVEDMNNILFLISSISKQTKELSNKALLVDNDENVDEQGLNECSDVRNLSIHTKDSLIKITGFINKLQNNTQGFASYMLRLQQTASKYNELANQNKDVLKSLVQISEMFETMTNELRLNTNLNVKDEQQLFSNNEKLSSLAKQMLFIVDSGMLKNEIDSVTTKENSESNPLNPNN